MSKGGNIDYKRDGAGQPVPAVPVLPPQEGDWSSNNKWGDQFTTIRGADGGTNMPKAAGLTLGILPKNSDTYGPPKVMTVNLYRSDGPQIGNADFYASVTYGVGGATNNFLCDWGHGTQFSLPVNNINVDAVSYAPNGNVPYAPDAEDGFFLGAMLAEGGAASAAPLTFTEPGITLADTQTATFDRPDFAVGVLVQLKNNDNPATATNLIMNFLSGAVILGGYDLQVFAANLNDGIKIPGGSRQIQISNVSGAAHYVTVQWILAL